MRVLGFLVLIPLLAAGCSTPEVATAADVPAAGATVAQVPVGIVPSPTKTKKDVPYVPTPQEAVEGMLDLAQVTDEDVVYDLGSGDGRIVLAAARRGARAVGIDLDADLVERSRASAREAGLESRATFHHGDIFEVDLSEATVVTMYLLPAVNLELRPKLLKELRPGARVVSHDFDMEDWKPDKQVEVARRTLYLWTIPKSQASAPSLQGAALLLPLAAR